MSEQFSKKTLNQADQESLEQILIKTEEELTESEIKHLQARRAYLSAEDKERFKNVLETEIEAPEAPVEEPKASTTASDTSETPNTGSEAPQAPEVPADSSGDDSGKRKVSPEEREEMKKALTELGVPFPKNISSEKLKELFDEKVTVVE